MAAISNHLVLACWIIFLVYWLASAQRVKAVAEKQSLASALAHRLPVGLGWWLLAYPALPPPMNWVLIPRTDWARRTFAGNWSSDVTFIVTAGGDRVQRESGPMESIHPGDIAWFPPGEKHWHGAAPTTAMTHIAIAELLDGKAVDWLEKVTDEEYLAKSQK